MKATFLDLRRRPGKILEAVERRERVTLSKRGREIALIVPKEEAKRAFVVKDTGVVGIWKDRPEMKDPSEYVRKMREGRFGDL